VCVCAEYTCGSALGRYGGHHTCDTCNGLQASANFSSASHALAATPGSVDFRASTSVLGLFTVSTVP